MKTFRTIGFALFAILLCLSACSGGGDDPIDPTPKPEVVKSEITIDSSIISNGLSFTNEQGEQSISFTTNESWTLSVANTTSGATWCTASATSGTKGSSSVKFTITENTDYEDRSVSVTIKSGTASKTFTISQKGVDALLLTTDKYEVSQEGGTIEVEVKANIDYQMEISEDAKDWIKESSSRALTTKKHQLEIAMNEESEKREGEVYFKSGDKVETIKVYQAGGAIILLSQNEYTVSDAGDTISVEIKSNVEYGVQMPDVDWIVDEASSRGLSSHTLKYIVKANEEYDARSASIVFYDKNSELKDTLKVVQTQKDAIVISEKNVSVAKEGETVEIKVNTNVEFEVQIPSDVAWITQTDSRVLVEKSVYLKIAENMDEESRTAKIVFINKDSQISESVEITQAGTLKASYADGVVTLITAGTMKDLLGDNYLNITSLKVVGPINGDDVYCLRQMLGAKSFSQAEWGKLTTLDLSKASIIEGGKAYYGVLLTSNDEIGNYMFNECVNLENIVLPDGVISIGERSFSSCTSLAFIKISDSVTSIGNFAFAHCKSLTSIDIPNEVTLIGQNVFTSCTSLTSIAIPDAVISIGAYAFSNCISLADVTLGTGLTSIGDYAFALCSSLTSIDIPDGVTSIGDFIFKECTWLSSVTIGSGVLSVGNSAFIGCSSLNSVVLGANLTSIGSSAFENCSYLASVDIPDSVAEIGSYAFKGCSSLVTVTLGDGVVSIGSWAFHGCSSLASVTMNAGITSIGSLAFHNCSSLTSIEIPDSVTLIEDGVFSGCSSLSSVKLGTSVASIGNYAFRNCTSLTSITIPDEVTSIGFATFAHCYYLSTVHIGTSVTSIGDSAFLYCSSLADIYCYATTPPVIKTEASCHSFPFYTEITTLHVPKGCVTAYEESDWSKYFKTIVEME